MKKLICLTLLLVFVSHGFAQKAKRKSSPGSTPQSALRSMVETELAFARMSAVQGARPSFMAFIADDGILFRPHAVKGKQWLTEHPVPASDKRPLLSWYPSFADISKIGDMGYTTGPWEYRADIHQTAAGAWGNFLTVWKRQPDGSWKFVIDLGISNPRPAEANMPWQSPRNYQVPHLKKGFWTFDSDALLKRDREFSKASVSQGIPAAFAKFTARNVRTYREGKFPVVGQTLAGELLPETTFSWVWEPTFADVSSPNDLGYTYGTYAIAGKDSPKKPIEQGNYFRIWKKVGGKWLVVADLTNPVAEDKRN